MRETDSRDSLNVVLLSNYIPDAQESMLRFARLLRDGLIKRGHSVQVVSPMSILGGRNTTTGIAKWLGYLDKYVFFPPLLPSCVQGADIVHICDHSNAVYVSGLRDRAHVITCHDLLAVRSSLGEETYCPLTPMGKLLQRFILYGLRRARLIVCDSQATKMDAERLVGKRLKDGIRHVGLGLNYPFRVLSEEETLTRLDALPNLDTSLPFVLHVGSSEPRKNRAGVLRIFSRMAGRFHGQLVFAGAPLTEEMECLAHKLNVMDRVVSVSKPQDDVLEALYNRALVLLYPSRGEGFGWPIIEAQACGCPVITSNCGSCPEVAGAKALVHSIDDEDAFAASILRLADGSERSRFVELGFENLQNFSADAMVNSYIALYREVIATSR